MTHARLWRGDSQNSQNAAPDDGYDCYRESARGNWRIAGDYVRGNIDPHEHYTGPADGWQRAILKYRDAIGCLLLIPESKRTGQDKENINLCHHMTAELYAKQGLHVLAEDARLNVQSMAQSQDAGLSLRLSSSSSQ